MCKNMFKFVITFIFVIVTWADGTWGTRTVENHLSSNDLTRLQKVFIDAFSSNDLQSIFYASLNISPKEISEKAALCKKLDGIHQDSKLNNFEKDFYYIGIHKTLCTGKLSEPIAARTKAAISKDIGSAQEIYYRLATHTLLGVPIDENANAIIVKLLQDILKKDDSIVNLGYSFHIAADLGGNAAFVANRIEDAIVQADEVDGKMLQFEGGLSITALVINGVVRVSNAFNKPSPINSDQAVRFATYFLSRRSVQTAKGAHVLIEALKSLSSMADIAPICIQIIGNGQLQTDAPILNIAITDLLGKTVSPTPQNIYGKIVLKKDSTVLAEKVQFLSKSSDKTTFATDLSTYKPVRGIYTIDITSDKVYQQKLQFKVLGRVKVNSMEVGVAESDSTSSVKKLSINYPSTLTELLEADNTQKLLLKTALVDESTGKSISVHQAFVRLYNKETDQEIIFVAEQDSTKAYKFDMDVGARGGDFGYKSGEYEIHLIVGDASLSNSFAWHVANVQLRFAAKAKDTKKFNQHRAALPEIVHQFRAPEKRPPRLVSDIFTGLCLTPLVLLIIFWSKLGINVSNFTFAPATVGFHLGFGAILALFAVFWWKLNMFQTLRLLLPIAIFTFLCGNVLLRRLYARRLAKSGANAS